MYELDLHSIFQGPTVSPDLPRNIFAKRETQRGLGAITDAIALGEVLEPELPLPGSILGQYRLECMIGFGGFGVIYRARHLVQQHLVVIKIMRPKVIRAQPELVRLLNEEAGFASKIDHPNVVRIIDFVSNSKQAYIVMEYVDGPDLAVVIKRRGALPHKMVNRILRHIAAALAAGLDQQLVHRDIKPSNILLTTAGVTKLTDFGLARSSSVAETKGLRGVVGTLEYMAPEQANNPDAVDLRSDIYALGVSAYQALTATLPFVYSDPKQLSAAHHAQTIEPPHRRTPGIPANFSALVVAMMERNPRHRPSSYAELITLLDQCRAENQ